MRHFSSPRVNGLEFTMYDNGSGVAEYNGKKVGEIDYNTNEIRLKDDNWRTIYSTDSLTDVFIEKTENYFLNNKHLIKEIAAMGKLDKASAAELLLTADMITIAELSPYFNEDKKAAIKLDETTAEFLINKSPELKQAFEDKGYDNWKEFFADNHGEAFLEANDDIGIKVVINDNKEYPIPLSPVEQAVLRDRLDEELKRRNKEYMHDKDGDRIPDNIDSSFDPETNRHYEQEDKNAATYDDDVKIRLVTDQELKCLKENETPVLVGKNRASNGLIPIKYKKEKESVVMAALAAIQHHEKKVVKR